MFIIITPYIHIRRTTRYMCCRRATSKIDEGNELSPSYEILLYYVTYFTRFKKMRNPEISDQ